MKILFGQSGFIEIVSQKKEYKHQLILLNDITSINDNKTIKSNLLNENIINIRYLEELLRLQYSMILPNEKVIILEENEKTS